MSKIKDLVHLKRSRNNVAHSINRIEGDLIYALCDTEHGIHRSSVDYWEAESGSPCPWARCKKCVQVEDAEAGLQLE